MSIMEQQMQDQIELWRVGAREGTWRALANAYEDFSNRDIACGKAKPTDYTICLCGYSTHAIVKQNGNSWICNDPTCIKESRFEEVKR